MVGIQVFGAPSTNLKPGRSFTSQNQRTSGRDTAKPRKAKMLATQRIAFLCSPGMSMSTTAPTSGVNNMIERMWLYI